jgi:hypothetical protein
MDESCKRRWFFRIVWAISMVVMPIYVEVNYPNGPWGVALPILVISTLFCALSEGT